MKLPIVKTPDPVFEVCSILEAKANRILGSGSEFMRGVKASAEYYTKPLGITAKQSKEWFKPLLEIETHVLKGIDLPQKQLVTFFGRPVEDMQSAAWLVSRLKSENVTALNAAAFFFESISEETVESLELSLSEFIRRANALEVPSEHILNLASVIADWDNARRIIKDAISKGGVLFLEKVHLAAELIDEWYTMTDAHNIEGGGILGDDIVMLAYSRELTICPSLVQFMSLSAFLTRDAGYGANVKGEFFHYGILVDKLYVARNANGGDLQHTLKALGDKQRFKIVTALLKKPMFSSEIAALLGLSPATVSHHMNDLMTAGLVYMEESGNRVLNKISDKGCHRFIERLNDMFSQTAKK